MDKRMTDLMTVSNAISSSPAFNMKMLVDALGILNERISWNALTVIENEYLGKNDICICVHPTKARAIRDYFNGVKNDK